MIILDASNGHLTLITQTEHSHLVGELAAHWGNASFAAPEPYDSVSRAAVFHDYGWLRYETAPQLNPATERPYQFLELPFSQDQTDAYQWCIDWLTGIDPYSGLIVSMHRTGLWKNRYDTMIHPSGKYDLKGLRPEIQALIDHNEARQQAQQAELSESQVWTNYRLMQVWDLLGLYFCCQKPYDDYIEPVPVSYAGDRGTDVRLTMQPAGEGRVAFDPYPFNERPLRVEMVSRRLAQSSFSDQASFRRAYFQAPKELIQYELV
jgi:hypothetical protein